MKMAVQYWLNRGIAGRTRFVAFKGGYHGDTTGAMAVCDPEPGCMRCSPVCCRAHFILDLPREEASQAALDRLLASRAGEIAGIIVEPLVQGAGGMRFHDAAVLRRLRAAADRHDLLLIFDEIFTGFGRTGSLFACAGRRGSRYHHALEGAHRRNPAACRHRCDHQGVRSLLVGGSGARPDAWADLYGRMRSPARPPMRRSICSSSEPRLQQVAGIRGRAGAGPGALPRHVRRQGRARARRDRRRRARPHRRSRCDAGSLRRPRASSSVRSALPCISRRPLRSRPTSWRP